MELNKFKFNIVTKKDKKYIYDIIRKKYILLTEEEKVRQIKQSKLERKKNKPKKNLFNFRFWEWMG